MTTRARRTAGTPSTWGDLSDDEHAGHALTFAWPWAPDDSVTVTFLRRGYLAGTEPRQVAEAVRDDDTGVELEPARFEYVERWVHYVDHPEWGPNSTELAADHPVTIGDPA